MQIVFNRLSLTINLVGVCRGAKLDLVDFLEIVKKFIIFGELKYLQRNTRGFCSLGTPLVMGLFFTLHHIIREKCAFYLHCVSVNLYKYPI